MDYKLLLFIGLIGVVYGQCPNPANNHNMTNAYTFGPVTQIPMDFSRSDVLLCPFLEDWYRVTLPAGSTRYLLGMGVQYEHSLGDVDIEMRSENNTVLASSGDIDGFEAVGVDNAPEVYRYANSSIQIPYIVGVTIEYASGTNSSSSSNSTSTSTSSNPTLNSTSTSTSTSTSLNPTLSPTSTSTSTSSSFNPTLSSTLTSTSTSSSFNPTLSSTSSSFNPTSTSSSFNPTIGFSSSGDTGSTSGVHNRGRGRGDGGSNSASGVHISALVVIIALVAVTVL